MDYRILGAGGRDFFFPAYRVGPGKRLDAMSQVG